MHSLYSVECHNFGIVSAAWGWICAHIVTIEWYMALCWTRLFSGHSTVPLFYIASLFCSWHKPDQHRHTPAHKANSPGNICLFVCVGLHVISCSCVRQRFMGWCHSYAVMPSRDLQNSHLRFYAVWQGPERGRQGHGETASFMAQTNLCWCQGVPGTVTLFSGCSRKLYSKKIILFLKRQLLKQVGATSGVDSKTNRNAFIISAFIHCARTSILTISVVWVCGYINTLDNELPALKS